VTLTLMLLGALMAGAVLGFLLAIFLTRLGEDDSRLWKPE
jgi:hypothetical protein